MKTKIMTELYNRYGDKNYLDKVDEHIYILRLDPKSEGYCRFGLREGHEWEDKDYDFVTKDIAAVVEAAQGRVVKVIIEACLLTDEEKVEACRCSVKAGADFVKTSTGFSTGGATPEDVKLMYETVKDTGLKVKAAGGIRSLADAEKMIEAGAERLGCSAGMQIMKDFEAKQ